MPQITFLPQSKTIECGADETVFVAARRAGILLPTACVGRGSCGLCRVKVLAGEECLPPVTKAEKFHLGNTYFITKLRLSCQLTASGDVTLQVPDAVGKKLPQLSGK
jgi:ferredoxin